MYMLDAHTMHTRCAHYSTLERTLCTLDAHTMHTRHAHYAH